MFNSYIEFIGSIRIFHILSRACNKDLIFTAFRLSNPIISMYRMCTECQVCISAMQKDIKDIVVQSLWEII